ncbi:MAG: hypothetical protein ACON47_06705 [Flavobacteriaceae bacterium]
MKNYIYLLIFSIVLVSCSKKEETSLQELNLGNQIEEPTAEKVDLVTNISNLSTEQQAQNLQNTGFAALRSLPTPENIQEFIELLEDLKNNPNAVPTSPMLPKININSDFGFQNLASDLDLSAKSTRNKTKGAKVRQFSKSAAQQNSQVIFDEWIHKLKTIYPLHIIDKNDPTQFTILNIETYNENAEYTLEIPYGDYIYILGNPRATQLMDIGVDQAQAMAIEAFYDLYGYIVEDDYYMSDYPYGITETLDLYDFGEFNYDADNQLSISLNPYTDMGLITVEKGNQLEKVEIFIDYNEEDNTVYNWAIKTMPEESVSGTEVFFSYMKTESYTSSGTWEEDERKVYVNLTKNDGQTITENIPRVGNKNHDNYKFFLQQSVELLVNTLGSEMIIFDQNAYEVFLALGGSLNERFLQINDQALEAYLIREGIDRTKKDGSVLGYMWDKNFEEVLSHTDGYVSVIDLFMMQYFSFASWDDNSHFPIKISDVSILEHAISLETIRLEMSENRSRLVNGFVFPRFTDRKINVHYNRNNIVDDVNNIPSPENLNIRKLSLYSGIEPQFIHWNVYAPIDNVDHVAWQPPSGWTEDLLSQTTSGTAFGYSLNFTDYLSAKKFDVGLYSSSSSHDYNNRLDLYVELQNCSYKEVRIENTFREMSNSNQLDDLYQNNNNIYNSVTIMDASQVDTHCEKRFFRRYNISN